MPLSNFLRRRTGGQKSAPEATVLATDERTSEEPSAKEVFQRPDLLANRAAAHFVEGIPVERDYDLLPDADIRDSLEITPEQRDRCLREYSVLRVAGVSLCVKQNYEDAFWLIFTDRIVPALNKRLDQLPSTVNHAETRSAVEEYVLAGESAKPEAIATIYMRRVYDDNPNYIRMKVSGIGDIANNTLLSTYDIFRDAYCQVKYGLSYETLKALNSAVESKAGEA